MPRGSVLFGVSAVQCFCAVNTVFRYFTAAINVSPVSANTSAAARSQDLRDTTRTTGFYYVSCSLRVRRHATARASRFPS